ncbi:sugar kinase [Arthrobacter sp. MSA 4-2]|uniref:FGGY-family carbohydrate kinase n=1 Tax=Arthrobacter sp. MSA 4-2 TaxID=2794349 RepID=UPI0018E7F2FE|nr:FGGY family carbohydrate kinase [Arthrobacter sp. MSA 4-2]MBJ2119459.1 sugar kinase [Arthrobacter sp. MSA 4-2]
MKLFLGIDIGTFETKGVLVDEQGTVRARARRRHGISTPAPGRVEQDADLVWWSDFAAVSRELMASEAAASGSIEAVGCSAIGPCVLPLDEDLRPLRPGILYGVDTRATAEIDALTERFGEEAILARSGNLLTSQSGGPKVVWIGNNEPDIAARTRWYVTAHGYIVARLTGRVTMDHGTAGYFHPFYRLADTKWDLSGCEDLIAPERLPELGWSTDIAGTITESAAGETGLPPGIPVIFGAVDAPAEAVSASVVNEGDLMLMYGSSTYMIKVTNAPIPGRVLWSAPYVFPGTFVLAAGTSTAGTLTRWMADILGLDDGSGDNELFGRLLALAGESPPGSRGLLLMPHFSGERTPVHDAHSRGALIGLSLDHNRADIARAVLEGVAHSVAHALSAYAEVGELPRRVIAVGGGTKNPIFTQSVTDITGLSQSIAETDGAAVGDAALAALAVGALKDRESIGQWVKLGQPIGPDEASADTLRNDHEDYVELYETLSALNTARAVRLHGR